MMRKSVKRIPVAILRTTQQEFEIENSLRSELKVTHTRRYEIYTNSDGLIANGIVSVDSKDIGVTAASYYSLYPGRLRVNHPSATDNFPIDVKKIKLSSPRFQLFSELLIPTIEKIAEKENLKIVYPPTYEILINRTKNKNLLRKSPSKD
jgi:hypothetical protein